MNKSKPINNASMISFSAVGRLFEQPVSLKKLWQFDRRGHISRCAASIVPLLMSPNMQIHPSSRLSNTDRSQEVAIITMTSGWY
jgi:hypothetical protein